MSKWQWWGKTAFRRQKPIYIHTVCKFDCYYLVLKCYCDRRTVEYRAALAQELEMSTINQRVGRQSLLEHSLWADRHLARQPLPSQCVCEWNYAEKSVFSFKDLYSLMTNLSSSEPIWNWFLQVFSYCSEDRNHFFFSSVCQVAVVYSHLDHVICKPKLDILNKCNVSNSRLLIIDIIPACWDVFQPHQWT